MDCQYKIVEDKLLLKKLKKLGIIKFDSQTLTKITGLYSSKKFTCFYIDDAPIKFEFEGRIFGRKYFDGCFKPYLVEYFKN